MHDEFQALKLQVLEHRFLKLPLQVAIFRGFYSLKKENYKMIQTYSPTIRRKEMEAVLTCMVDEKIGPGDMNAKLVSAAKDMMGFDGALALRSPAIAIEYILNVLDVPKGSSIVISALAPSYQAIAIEKLGYVPEIVDVTENTGLMNFDCVAEAVKSGARLVILSESMGILPEIKKYLELNVPVIEDISQSAFAYYPGDDEGSEMQESAGVKQEPGFEAESSGSENENKAASENDSESSVQQEKLDDAQNYGKRAGMYGVYAIMGMESTDIITSGGGALLIAPSRREWIALKHYAENCPETDILPDMNASLGYVEIKEFNRNEKTRKDLFALYSRAVMSGRHKTFIRGNDGLSTVYGFPLVLNSGFKDAKSYAQKKNIEIRYAYENSVIALRQELLSSKCICANSLLLRCAMFPLYPRLGQKDATMIVKVLSSLP